jgi:uncharacterized RDD family membrane protein YckC
MLVRPYCTSRVQMTLVEPATASTPVTERYAGFWRRTLAVFLDTLVILAIGIIEGLILPAHEDFSYVGAYISFKTTSNFVWGELSGVPYTLIFWALYGATPGKMVLGLRIVNARTLGRVGLLRSILRYLAYFVSGVVFMLGFIWAAFDRRKQGWHDKIAGTIVIQTRF